MLIGHNSNETFAMLELPGHLTKAENIVKCILRFHHKNAGVAQLVEQLTCNQQVGGSSPLAGSIFLNQPTFPLIETLHKTGLSQRFICFCLDRT